MSKQKYPFLYFTIGLLLGLTLTVAGGAVSFKLYKVIKRPRRYEPAPVFKKVLNLFKPKKKAGLFYYSFESKRELESFVPEGIEAKIVKGDATAGRKLLKVSFSAAKGFPGIGWETNGKAVQDWSKFTHFTLDVINDSANNIPLIIKFKSGKSYPKKELEYPVLIEPDGLSQIRLPLEQLDGTLDLKEMSYVRFFVRDPHESFTFLMDNVGFPKDGGEDVSSGALSAVAGKIPETFDVYILSSLNKVFKDGKTLVKPNKLEAIDFSSARNEYETAQVVLHNGAKTLSGVSLEFSDLKHETNGAILDKQLLNWRKVDYVLTKRPYYPVKYVGLWPDPLMPVDFLEVPAGEHQPLWVSVYVPPNAEAGLYRGFVSVKADGHKTRSIPVSLKVFDFALPKEGRLKTAFDLYEDTTNDRYPRKSNESSDDYRRRIEHLNDKFLQMMLSYRMNPVLNVDPRNNKQMGRVDRYRLLGLNNFSIGRKGGTFANNWPKSQEGLKKLMPLYRTYGEMLALNKMLGFQYIYMWDEGGIGDPIVPKIASMIKAAYKDLKTLVCYHGIWDPKEHPGWGDDIDIWCVQISSYIQEKADVLRKLGKEIWIYPSGPSSDGTPNLAIDFDAADPRIIPWMAWKFDIQGILYWCVNWWPYKDPFQDAANTKWEQNGNGLMFYPGENGPVASLRAEIFRDGMEDYEYFVLLKQSLERLKKSPAAAQNKKLISQAEKLLYIPDTITKSMQSFTRDGKTIKEYRDEVGEMIQRLNEGRGK